MSSATQIIGRMGLLERCLAIGTLFYSGVAFCLPVPPNEEIAALYPWWANKIAIGNLQLYELLFLAWLPLFGRRFVPRVLLNGGIPAWQAALLLVLLAAWCGIISLTAPLALTDLGRTLRLFLNAALLLAVVRWTRRSGDLPLIALITGFLTGSIINLVFSFRYPLVVANTMRLSGQNTPGVAMGVASLLCAWLFLHTGRLGWRVLAVLATGVFIFGCAISFSRIGWFTGACGLLAWAYILFVARPPDPAQRRLMRRTRLALVPLIITGMTLLFSSPLGQQGMGWMQTLVEQKESNQTESDETRWAYVLGTAEILLRRPFGVGYSGFYDAMTATDVYHNGVAAPEESAVAANPHATFLWYTTTGGIPAFFMMLLTFLLLLHSLRVGLSSAFGRPGQLLFLLAAVPFTLIGMTVPYLFNSVILIVPAAIAAGWGWTHRAKAAAGASDQRT